MKFETYIPNDILKRFAKLLAIQELHDERSYRVLPDTCLVIGFQYKGGLSYLETKQKILLSTSGISGLSDHFKIFENSNNIATILAFLKRPGLFLSSTNLSANYFARVSPWIILCSAQNFSW